MKFSIDQNAVILALSRALEFTVSGIAEHHSGVAVIAEKLAESLNLSERDKTVLLYACLLHDAGVSSSGEKGKLEEFDVVEGSDHAERGYRLLMSYPPLEEIAHVVRYHHDKWEGGNPSGLSKHEIPLLSGMVFLADRIDVLLEKDVYVLEQKKGVCESVNNYRGMYFRPDLVDCFNKLALAESFWLDLAPANAHNFLDRIVAEQDKVVVDVETLMNLGE
ncbi:MAG: HD domain-containing protein, partial [Candidatus Brocadiales bacterium]|nr:HD domain-containing protein [Candidatus Bathyanammoxibius sp.]